MDVTFQITSSAMSDEHTVLRTFDLIPLPNASCFLGVGVSPSSHGSGGVVGGLDEYSSL